MKIGILSVYFADYGSYFHTLSLLDFLLKLGYDAEIIDESHRYRYSPRLFASSLLCGHLPAGVNDYIGSRITPYNTYNVLKNDLSRAPVSKRTFFSRDRYEGYDCVIVGSDELWSATNPTVGFVPDYYGIGMTCPHFSYSTSGITLDPDRLSPRKREIIERGLKTFEAVAVRDRTTKKWVEKLSGRECETVLDPALLNPFYVNNSDETKPYVLVYGEDFTDAQAENIKSYARKNGLSLLSTAWRHPWCDEFLEAKSAVDIQAAFASASYCAVSTFHGTVFSTVHHKPFTSFVSPARGRKVRELLEDIGLASRLSENEIKTDAIDYDRVEKTLSGLRKKSEKYIRKSLKICLGEGEKLCGRALCTGCGACKGVCRFDAIEMKADENGFLYPEISLDKCRDCGLCAEACPILNDRKRDAVYPEIYALKTRDEKVLRSSASGGAFSVIAEKIISRGGCVFGAAWGRDFDAEFIKAESSDALAPLRGSKYVQSYAGDIYPAVKEELEKGRPTLFTGLPCQVAGLYGYLGKDYDDLFTADLVCHGCGSPAVFKSSIKVLEGERGARLIKIDQTDKSAPWNILIQKTVRYDFEDGSVLCRDSSEDPYLSLFLGSSLYREGCYKCKFASLPRQGDLTLGDFFGFGTVKRRNMDTSGGISQLSVNTRKGRELFDRISDHGALITRCEMKECAYYNHFFWRPSPRPGARNEIFDVFHAEGFEGITDKYYNSPKAVRNRKIRSVIKKILGYRLTAAGMLAFYGLTGTIKRAKAAVEDKKITENEK